MNEGLCDQNVAQRLREHQRDREGTRTSQRERKTDTQMSLLFSPYLVLDGLGECKRITIPGSASMG